MMQYYLYFFYVNIFKLKYVSNWLIWEKCLRMRIDKGINFFMNLSTLIDWPQSMYATIEKYIFNTVEYKIKLRAQCRDNRQKCDVPKRNWNGWLSKFCDLAIDTDTNKKYWACTDKEDTIEYIMPIKWRYKDSTDMAYGWSLVWIVAIIHILI